MIYLQALQPLCFDGGQHVPHEAASTALPCTRADGGSNAGDGWYWTSPSNGSCGPATMVDSEGALLEPAGGLYRRPRGRASNSRPVASRRVLAPVERQA